MTVEIFCCFFKPSTAYVILISDCRSDVCSSDLCSLRDENPGNDGILDLRPGDFQLTRQRLQIVVERFGTLGAGQLSNYMTPDLQPLARARLAELQIGRTECRERVSCKCKSRLSTRT